MFERHVENVPTIPEKVILSAYNNGDSNVIVGFFNVRNQTLLIKDALFIFIMSMYTIFSLSTKKLPRSLHDVFS